MFALVDLLGIRAFKGVRISAGDNVLLHTADRRPARVNAMALVSATPYFPEQARATMRSYSNTLPRQELQRLRQRQHGRRHRSKPLLDSTAAFAESYDDINFSPPQLATIRARTLVVRGDRDPLYPVEISVQMAKSIPNASLWVVLNAGHGLVIGTRWSEFVRSAAAFLRD